MGLCLGNTQRQGCKNTHLTGESFSSLHPHRSIFWLISIQILIRRIRSQKGLQAWTPKLWHASKFPGALVRTQISGSHPGNSDSVGLEWSLTMCISNKSPSDAHAAGLRTRCTALEIIFLTAQTCCCLMLGRLLSDILQRCFFCVPTWLSVLYTQRYF